MQCMYYAASTVQYAKNLLQPKWKINTRKTKNEQKLKPFSAV